MDHALSHTGVVRMPAMEGLFSRNGKKRDTPLLGIWFFLEYLENYWQMHSPVSRASFVEPRILPQ